MRDYPFSEAASIVLDIPTETITTTEPYLQISGGAQRINSLSLNGRDLILTESGTFSEDILLAEGYNELVFLAVDEQGERHVRLCMCFMPHHRKRPLKKSYNLTE